VLVKIITLMFLLLMEHLVLHLEDISLVVVLAETKDSDLVYLVLLQVVVETVVVLLVAVVMLLVTLVEAAEAALTVLVLVHPKSVVPVELVL